MVLLYNLSDKDSLGIGNNPIPLFVPAQRRIQRHPSEGVSFLPATKPATKLPCFVAYCLLRCPGLTLGRFTPKKSHV